MQYLDNLIIMFIKCGKLGICWYLSKQGYGELNFIWILIGNQVICCIVVKIDGVVGGIWGELFNILFIVYFFGGVVIGDDFEYGVIDFYYWVYGYLMLYVVDGVVILVNLGVNLLLFIVV